MARKRFGDDEILNLLRQIELSLASGADVATACRSAGVSDTSYYNWRKKYGGMGKSQLRELKAGRLITRKSRDFGERKAFSFPGAIRNESASITKIAL